MKIKKNKKKEMKKSNFFQEQKSLFSEQEMLITKKAGILTCPFSGEILEVNDKKWTQGHIIIKQSLKDLEKFKELECKELELECKSKPFKMGWAFAPELSDINYKSSKNSNEAAKYLKKKIKVNSVKEISLKAINEYIHSSLMSLYRFFGPCIAQSRFYKPYFKHYFNCLQKTRNSIEDRGFIIGPTLKENNILDFSTKSFLPHYVEYPNFSAICIPIPHFSGTTNKQDQYCINTDDLDLVLVNFPLPTENGDILYQEKVFDKEEITIENLKNFMNFGLPNVSLWEPSDYIEHIKHINNNIKDISKFSSEAYDTYLMSLYKYLINKKCFLHT